MRNENHAVRGIVEPTEMIVGGHLDGYRTGNYSTRLAGKSLPIGSRLDCSRNPVTGRVNSWPLSCRMRLPEDQEQNVS